MSSCSSSESELVLSCFGGIKFEFAWTNDKLTAIKCVAMFVQENIPCWEGGLEGDQNDDIRNFFKKTRTVASTLIEKDNDEVIVLDKTRTNFFSIRCKVTQNRKEVHQNRMQAFFLHGNLENAEISKIEKTFCGIYFCGSTIFNDFTKLPV